MSGDAGKGDKRRPMSISRAEYDLRWDFIGGLISEQEFYERLAEIKKGNLDALQCNFENHDHLHPAD